MGRWLLGDVLSVRGLGRRRRCVSWRDCAQGALGLSEHVVGYEPESRKGGPVKTLFITRERTKLGSGGRRPAPATTSALVIGEARATTAELLLQDTVLLDEVGDDLRLLAVDPAGERGEQKLKREEVGHRAG